MAPAPSRFGLRPGPVPFCQAFVRCCQATYCLCPPFCRHYLTTAKKILSTHPLSAQGACPVCTGPDFKKKKSPKIGFRRISLFSASLDLPRRSKPDREENDVCWRALSGVLAKFSIFRLLQQPVMPMISIHILHEVRGPGQGRPGPAKQGL